MNESQIILAENQIKNETRVKIDIKTNNEGRCRK